MDQIVDKPDSSVGSRVGAPRPRRRGYGLFSFVLLVGAGAALWFWTHPQKAEVASRPARGEQTQSVAVASVTKADVPVLYDGLGTVTALATVTVKTQISGQLTDIGFREGQMVKKGDFLAQIDPRPYQVALEQAQGALARDQALLKNAEIDLQRYQRLAQQDSIAHQQVDTQAALVQQDRGTIEADKAQIDSANLNLAYCRITAPIDGRVGLRQVDAGNYVQTTDTNGLVVITQLQPISVIFTQPEDRLPAIQRRLHAGAVLPVTLYDRSGTRVLAEGHLATLDNQIDTTTGTAKLRAVFDNADEALFPNQFVNTKVLLDTLKDATVVANAAIQIGTPGAYVYRVKADDTVAMTPIKTGQTTSQVTAVLEGLSPGDRVVVDGIDRLRDGAKVRIPGETGKGSDPAQPHGWSKDSGGDGDSQTTRHRRRDKTTPPAPSGTQP